MKFTDEYKKIHNINNLENDWYEYVEFGSMDKLIIFLQRNGYTREAANYINENMQTYIIYDNDDYKIKKDILNCNVEYVIKETNNIILNVPELFI